MSNEEILKKSIEKSAKNGFKWTEFFGSGGFYVPGTIEEVVNQLFNSGAESKVIFSHDFAKCFFGEERFLATNGINDLGEQEDWYFKGWQYHIQQLALAEDRFKYLEQFLEE